MRILIVTLLLLANVGLASEAHNLVNKAANLSRLGQYNSAINLLNQAEAIDSDIAEIYLSRAIAYAGGGNHTQALKDYNRAFEGGVSSVEAYKGRAESYFSLHNYHEALEDYYKVYQADRNNLVALHRIGVIADMYNEKDMALRFLSKAIDVKPTYDAYIARGNIFRKHRQMRHAVRDFTLATHLRPKRAEAHSYLCMILGDAGDFNNAMGSCDAAVAIQPNNAKALFNRAITLDNLGETVSAAKDLRRALRINPNFGEARKMLSRVDFDE